MEGHPVKWEWLKEVAAEHRYKIIGGLGGFLFALLVVWFGWWALFILFCTGIGYWIGKRMDEGPESLVQIFERLLPPRRR
ncbi:MAG: DUF2273 domain-containing protein [Symbiobacterium thermophilum]|uniref:DUF2273 domain-containing protein n=1 Tax=Symbiobacterium thermophilum TaxID=2734 RepID=A0A953LI52_SYMTR|nr:DUF2273 domain-containing protein [Symbiobacterium thermophilum]